MMQKYKLTISFDFYLEVWGWVLHMLHSVSAYPIIGIDIHEEKLDIAKKFGITHAFISDGSNVFKN